MTRTLRSLWLLGLASPVLLCAVVVVARAGITGRVGPGGTVTTAIGPRFDQAHAVIREPDGSLVAAGFSEDGFALVRYGADGSLDTSFGHGGTVTTDTDHVEGGGAGAVVRQPDGKLVAAGANFYGLALVRYNPNGSLDRSFGHDGKATVAVGIDGGTAGALVLQPDGKLVAAGEASLKLLSPRNFALVRCNPHGTVDTSFGRRGRITTAFDPDRDATALALIRQPDGKLVAAGGLSHGSFGAFALVRYDPDGKLDTSFGRLGKTTTALGSGYAEARALLLQRDGKLVAVGVAHRRSRSRANFALVRYNPDGSLDTSFGQGGKVQTAIGPGDAIANALALQPDGRLIAAGNSLEDTRSAFTLARYNPNGTLDTSFGHGGTVTTAIGRGRSYATALLLQPDGKPVAVGYSTGRKDRTLFTLARYNPDGTLDASFGRHRR